MTHATIANWNVEWASIESARGKSIRALLEGRSPDVVCLTEVIRGFFAGGNVIEADADYGYPRTGGRRKAMLWSKNPWRDICRGEAFAFPAGRLVSGVTDTLIGALRVVGVCIPWRDAHVRTGRRDKEPWADHLQFLQALEAYLAGHADPVVVIGDFNQRVPKSRQPDEVYERLSRCFDGRMKIATTGLVDTKGTAAIDHLAVSRDLVVDDLEILPAVNSEGTRLSDHFGFSASLHCAVTVQKPTWRTR